MRELEPLFRRGVMLHQEGNLGEAESLYRLVLKGNPLHDGAYHLLACICLVQRKYNQSLRLFEKALSLSPDKASPHNNYGVLLREIKRFDDAINAFRKAIELNPDYADAWANLGQLLMTQSKLQEADDALRKSLALSPKHQDALKHLAELRFRQGRNLLHRESFAVATKTFEESSLMPGGKPLWKYNALGFCPTVFCDEPSIDRYWGTLDAGLDELLDTEIPMDWKTLPVDGFYLFSYSGCYDATLRIYSMNDSLPEVDETVEIWYELTACIGLDVWEFSGSDSVTIKDNDNWTVAATVTDDVAAEPCTCHTVSERSGAIEIRRTPGDIYCDDLSYGILVEFELGGTALPQGVSVGSDYYLTTNLSGGQGTIGVQYDQIGEVWKGSVTIPVGQESVLLYVVPNADLVFEADETVTLTVTKANSIDPTKPFNVGISSGSVAIRQAPEFISDVDENNDPELPIPINSDFYQTFIRKSALAGEEITTLNPIYAVSNGEVRYSIVSGNELGLFEIDELTGVITATVDLSEVANLPATVNLDVVAVKPGGCVILPGPNGGGTATGGVGTGTVSIIVSQWGVLRDGEETAAAISEVGCTIKDLAKEIGLDAGEFKKWLTFTTDTITLFNGSTVSPENLGVSDILAANQEFEIPNAIYMAWFGEMGSLGQGWMLWGQNKSDLKKLGFYVEEFNNDTYSPSAPDAAKLSFKTRLHALSERKQLHGLYMMGHGSEYVVGSNGTKCYTVGPDWFIDYRTPDATPGYTYRLGDGSDSIGGQINYHLGALIIHACESENNNARSLYCEEGGIFVGQTGTYFPIIGVERIAVHWGIKVTPIWGGEKHEYGGKQRTNKFTETDHSD